MYDPIVEQRKTIAPVSENACVPAPIQASLRRHLDDVLSALRFSDEHVSRAERTEGLVSGRIERNPFTLRVLLEGVPPGTVSQAIHQAFETEYLNLHIRERIWPGLPRD